MAKKVAVEALLKLRDEISQNSKRVDKALGKLDKTTRKTKGSVKALGASLAKVGLGLGIASIALKKVLAAQSLQIKSINSLNLALANQGNLLPGTSQRLQEYASELQGITTFGDEVILQNQALLASFGMNENQLKTTTKAALDFAAATGSDLKAAVNLLGKALRRRDGIVIPIRDRDRLEPIEDREVRCCDPATDDAFRGRRSSGNEDVHGANGAAR